MKKLFNIIFAILLGISIFWGVSILHCEYLTTKYDQAFDFNLMLKENTMLTEPEQIKVLSCKSDKAKIYYIEKNFSTGNLLTFKKVNNTWEYDGWETLWSSRGGSADEDVWPYFWHSLQYR